MRSLWIIGIAIMMQSCGAKYHLKNALAKDPSLADTTIVLKDTIVITKSVEVRDTITLTQHDTIVRIKDRVVTRFKLVSDTLWFEVECPTDTIKIVQQTQNIKIEQPKDKMSPVTKAILLLWIMIFSIVIGKTIIEKIL